MAGRAAGDLHLSVMNMGYFALQNYMEKQYPEVELDISISDDQIEAELLAALTFAELERVVQSSLYEAAVTQPVSLALTVTDDATIQELNKRYRQQDRPTDVLSFPLLDKPLVDAPGNQLWATSEEILEHEHVAKTKEDLPVFVTPSELPTNLGDIVISWPTVVQQARETKHSPAYELLYLLAHGVLHLVGYDDQTEAGYAAMVHLQESILQAVGRKEAPQDA
jgi:probable rRNA maturation factor